jgi:hypothetical protein
MRTKLTLLAVGLAATFAATPEQAASTRRRSTVTPVVSCDGGSAAGAALGRSNTVIAWNANAGEAAITASPRRRPAP